MEKEHSRRSPLMNNLYIYCEGQTEEAFINNVPPKTDSDVAQQHIVLECKNQIQKNPQYRLFSFLMSPFNSNYIL